MIPSFSHFFVIYAELTQWDIYIGAPEEGKQSRQKQFLQIRVCFTSEEPYTVIRKFGFFGGGENGHEPVFVVDFFGRDDIIGINLVDPSR